MSRSFYSWLFFLFLIVLISEASAQTDSIKYKSRDSTFLANYPQRNISILVGYNFWGHHFGELGVALSYYSVTGSHMFSAVAFTSAEIEIQKNPIIGPKIGVWAAGGSSGVGMGFNLIYYTDFEESSLRFRPEIGFGIHRFKVLYGYNIPLNNKDFKGINTHIVSFAMLFSIKKLKSEK